VINEICEFVKQKNRELSKDTENTRLIKEHQMSNLTEGINKLYFDVSQNQLKLDDHLNCYLEGLKNQKETLQKEIEDIKRRSKLSYWRFGDKNKAKFINAVLDVFSDNNKIAAKAYLLAIVDIITVSVDEVIIKGGNYKLVNSISKTKTGTSNEVPISVSEWR